MKLCFFKPLTCTQLNLVNLNYLGFKYCLQPLYTKQTPNLRLTFLDSRALDCIRAGSQVQSPGLGQYSGS